MFVTYCVLRVGPINVLHLPDAAPEGCHLQHKLQSVTIHAQEYDGAGVHEWGVTWMKSKWM
jgi:hypothetical protein